MSVYDGEKFSAEESFNDFKEKGYSSSGVLSVTNQECDNEILPRISDNDTFDGHVLIDFTACSKAEIEKKAKKLRDAALNRGWQYNKPSEENDDENDPTLPF